MLLSFALGLFDWFDRSPDEGDGGAGGGGDGDEGDDGDGEGGADDDPNNADGGAEGDDGEGEGDDGKGKGAVPRADHDRVLADMHRYKQRSKTQATQIATLQSEIARLKAGGKGSKGDDGYKAKFEAAEQKNAELTRSFIDGKKVDALIPMLKAAGLRGDAEDFVRSELDLDELDHELTNKGRVNLIGADSFVADVKQRYPFVFEAKKAKKVNGGGGGNGSGSGGDGKVEWNGDKLFKLEQECKRKGNMEPYKKAIQEFREQQKKKK